MKSIVHFLLLLILSVPVASGQIKIGDNPQNIDAASVLELESSNRVLVITRVSTAEMEAIVPQRGGVVYNTETQCVHYYNGTEWINLCDAVSFSLTNDPIENIASTISIVDNGGTINLEVAQNSIRSENIVDGGINGDDIQDNSIGESKLGTDSVSSNELRDNSVGSSEVIDGSIRPTDLANTTPAQVLTTNEFGIPQWEDATNLTTDVAMDIAENAMDIADHIINDNDTDDRNELTDLDFDPATSILSLTRSETAVGQEVNLSDLNNAGTDSQTLNLTGNTLAITGGNNVSLVDFLDNTDAQALTINPAGTQISLTNGGTINLPPGTVNTDNQQLSINPAGTIISLTNGGSVTLPAGTVNTDEQDLSRTGNTINITGGAGVDLTPILGSNADGVISQVALAGTNLNFTGADGGFNGTVSLAGLGGGSADGALTNVILNGTDLEFTSSAGGFTGDVSLASLGGGGGADGVITNMQLTGTDLVVTGTAPGFSGTIPLGTLANTDNQQLTLEQPGNLLTLADGGTAINLTPFLDNQTVTDFSFDDTTNFLSITLEDGNTQDVDLSALAAAAADNQTATEVPFTPTGNTASNQVQAAIEELQLEIDGISTGGAANPNDELITNFSLTGTELNIAEGANIPAPIDLDLTFATDVELTTAITASEALDLDKDAGNEIQPVISSDGSVGIAANGIGFDLSVPIGTDNQDIQGSILTGETLTIGIQNGIAQDVDISALTTDIELIAAITASEALDLDKDAGNEIQPVISSDGSVGIAANGIGFDLSVPSGTDNQDIQGSILTGETLTIGIQNGTAQDVDISALTTDIELIAAITASEALDLDKDAGNEIQPVISSDGSVGIVANGIGFDLSVAGGITDTDDQNIDEFQIDGANVLSISLIDDGALPSTVDLSPYLDNTDAQTANLVPVVATPTNYVAGTPDVEAHLAGIDAALAGGITDTDDQNIDEFQIDGANVLSISLIDDGALPSTVDLAPYLDNTDAQTANLVPVVATPTNYVAGTPDVEAHLVGIDAALAGGVSITGTSGSVFFADNVTGSPTENNAELFWDATNNRLGIGTNNPDRSLEVVGEIKSTSFASAGGTVGQPAYSFHTGTDTNTGMFRPAADEIGFSVGGTEALRAEEDGGNTNVIVNQSLELDGVLIDGNGDSGTPGQILSSTGGQTDWIDSPTAANINLSPALDVDGDTTNEITIQEAIAALVNFQPIKAFGKIQGNGLNLNVQGANVTGSGGSYTVSLDTPRPNDDYIIQLTTTGNVNIFILSQNTASFQVTIVPSGGGFPTPADWHFTVID